MKYLITEQQNNKLVNELTNRIKSNGWDNVAKLVGGDKNLIKLLGITSPMEFLHLYDDLNIVDSKEYPNWSLFRYNKGHNLMVLDKKNNNVYISYFDILLILEDVFGLQYSEIQKLTKVWLDEVYNLRGVTRYIKCNVPQNRWMRSII